MTEGNQDDANQQLNEDKEADEKPVQDISEQGTGDSVLQLASGNNLFIRRFQVSQILNMYSMIYYVELRGQ